MIYPMNYPGRIALALAHKHDPTDTKIFTEKVKAVNAGEYHEFLCVPAFAPNMAYGDIAKVERIEGELHFDEPIEESGRTVAHIVIWKPESKGHIIATLCDLDGGVSTHMADDCLVASISLGWLYQPTRTF